MPEATRLTRIRAALARVIAPAAAQPSPKAGKRMYSSARGSRLTGGFGSSSNASSDAELNTSLTQLRARSRQMIRDSAYAKRAKQLVVNNVIGSGVGLQAQVSTTRGQMAARVNADIEAAWYRWAAADQCHTGGAMHFCDLERALLGEVFEAGEALVRVHMRRFGNSSVPVALEFIEAERLADSLHQIARSSEASEVRLGIEVDAYQRPLAYWVRKRHPGDLHLGMPGRDESYERIPAEQIFHLRIVERWPQTRGVPWMHTVLRKLDSLAEYSQLEVDAARAGAAYFGTITTPEDNNPLKSAEEDDGSGVMDIDPLTIQALNPGEQLQFHTPNRPNPSFDAFFRAMLREVAVGTCTSYASLSSDHSQSNYSSSRLAMLDDRDTWRALQQWWIRSFRQPLHALWMRQAALAGAIPSVSAIAYGAEPDKFTAALFKPRGWSWVDPTKEVAAYKEAIKAGLTTLTDVIAATGGGQDIEDVVATRRRELDLLEENDIPSDVGEEPVPAGAPLPAGAALADAEDPADQTDQPDQTDGAPARARIVNLNARLQ